MTFRPIPLLLLCATHAYGQLDTALYVDFENHQWGTNWYYAGLMPTFGPSNGGLGLHMYPPTGQPSPISTVPFYPMAFIPIPGGYSPDHTYRLQAIGTADQQVPGLIESGYACLAWFDGTTVTYVPDGSVGFAAYPYVIGNTPWVLGGAALGPGTFGVVLRPENNQLDPMDPITFDDIVVTRKPFGASANNITLLLDGAYDAAAGRMRSDLRNNNLIPLTEPYTAMGYPQVNGGGETTTSSWLAETRFFTHQAVDWVRVELRSPSDPTQVVSTRQFLLWSNGKLVPAIGGDAIFNAQPGNYYVLVRHRNHLAVMTATPVNLVGNRDNNGIAGTTIDFRLASTATYGSNARKTQGNVMTLWSGNVVRNNLLQYAGPNNDRDPILVRVGGSTPNNSVSGYFAEDVNMDGLVKYTGAANDRDPILVNVGSTTPNNVRVEQVP